MHYPIELRERVLAFANDGNTIDESALTFKISSRTVGRWINLKKTTGNLEYKIPKKSAYKLKDSELLEFVNNNPDLYQREIAKHFGAVQSAVSSAFKRLNIKRKKKSIYTGKETKNL